MLLSLWTVSDFENNWHREALREVYDILLWSSMFIPNGKLTFKINTGLHKQV